MKIATWNLDRRNDNALDGVKTLIAEHEVLCLQEVHEDILDDVTALTEHHFIADECTYTCMCVCRMSDVCVCV